MNLFFEDHGKSVKSTFLKNVESNNNILKNLYEEIFVNDEGLVYSLESKLKNGRVFCNSSLHSVFEIPKDTLLKLNTKIISDCLKAGKTKILGCYTDENNNLYFRTTETDFNIGCYQPNKKLNIDYIKDILNNVDYKCNVDELLEKFENKEFINIRKRNYDLILTHKLFPTINKANSLDFYAKPNDDGTFYGIFKSNIVTKNKKEEVTFEMSVNYIYKFIDLN